MNLKGRLLIGAEWVETEKTFEVLNPYSQQVIGSFAFATTQETEEAVIAAHLALLDFADSLPGWRSEILLKIAHLVREQREELAQLITLEQGKSIHESRSEVDYALSFINWYAEESKRIYGDVVPSNKPNQRQFSLFQPIGVVAIITPWNFPLAMMVRKIAPMIAAGCTGVVKPSEETPFTALRFVELCLQAGLPAGVINLVAGDAKAIGEVLCASKQVKMLTFTGSTLVGKQLLAKAAPTVKRVCMELGGNAPFIVCKDADLELAARALVATKLRNGGQSCICANRILVDESVYERFLSQLLPLLQQIKIGDGADESVQLGPVISRVAQRRIGALVNKALDDGAQLVYQSEVEGGGCLVGIQVLAMRAAQGDIFSSEIFGPIIPIYKFNGREEALKIANDSDYGLAAYVFSNNAQEINYFINRLEYGMLGVNEVGISSAHTSFGGVKESGLGREGGRRGIMEFLEEKFVSWNFN